MRRAQSHGRQFDRRRLRAFAAVAVAVVVVAQTIAVAAAPTATPDADLWVVNGRVRAIAHVGDRIYIGGGFDMIGPPTGHGVVVGTSGGLASPAPRINGAVHAVLSDGAGGWYVGGEFTAVNGVHRSRGAHIRADGSLGPWDPLANGTIRAIARAGDRLILGGDFTVVRYASRPRVAKVDAVNGFVDPWRADIDGPVHALAVTPDGLRVIVGGSFLTVRGSIRPRVAALRIDNGNLDGLFSPTPDNAVRSIAISQDGQRVFLSGAFQSVSAIPRNRLAVVDAAMGTVDTSWTTGADKLVSTVGLSPDGGTLYVGGLFTKVGGQPRSRLAALDAVSGSLRPWNPGANGAVHALAVTPDGGRVYAGGDFTALGGASHLRGGVIDATTGAVLPFELRATAAVRAVASAGGPTFFGGDFNSVGASFRRNLAVLDATTGALVDGWAPAPNGEVREMELSPDGSRLFVVGAFTTIAGAPRGRGAAFDVASGAITGWNPQANGIINDIAINGSDVYLGGAFTVVRGLPVRVLARLDGTTAAVDATFVPSPDLQVHSVSVAPDGGRIYVGGEFNVIAAQPRPFLAALNPSGSLAAWSPNPPYLVHATEVSGDGTTVYAGLGGGGNGGNSVWAYAAGASAAERWHVETTGDVQALALSPDEQTVYAGGHFEHVLPDLHLRTALLALATSDGSLDPWAPNPKLDISGGNLGVWTIAPSSTGLLVGGDFTSVGTSVAQGVARFAGAP